MPSYVALAEQRPDLLEALSPEQRAALLLHDVFDYGYDEVADALGTTPANARQLTARARRHAKAGAPRFTSTGRPPT